MNATNSSCDEILVVDDMSASLKMLEGILSGAGYRVRLASDGELALRSARTQPPALVLLDIRMPCMDGYEVCRRLKADERTRSVPVIFLSIVDDEDEKVKAFQVGGVDFVSKPIRAAEVLARVSTHLALRHALLDLEARNAELEAIRSTLEERVAQRSAELEGANRQLQQQLAEHLRTLTALSESERRYRRVVDTATEGIWVLGPDTMTLFVNTKMAGMLGCSAKEIIGRPMTDFMFEEDVPDHLAKMENRRQGKPENYERRFRRRDGKEVWTQVSATPILDEEHRFGGAFGMFTDIADRKRAEESLHRANRELLALSNCNQALLHAEDEHALLTEICRIVCEEAGYRLAWVGFAENDEAKTIRPVAWAGTEDGYLQQAMLTWADTERGRGPSGTAIRTGRSETVGDFAADANADPWREAALARGYRASVALPLKDEDAKTFGILNIYSDTPNSFPPAEIRLLEELAADMAFGIVVLRARIERQRVEQVLRDSEEKFAAAFRASPNLIAITRLVDGTILDVNDGYSRMLGYSREESLGRSTSELSVWAEPTDRDAFVAALTKSGRVDDLETKLRRKDGTVITVLDSARTIVLRGEPCILSVVHDITERKRAEEERERLQGEFLHAQKMESVGRLAGGVAHDFNNLLTVILGYMELALEKVRAEDPLRTDLETVQSAGQRAVGLTRHLLAFARKQIASPRVLDLNETVANMLSMLRRLIGEDVELAWHPAEGLWPVKMDPSQIDQILANLCVNARDSISEVGAITIEARNAVLGDAHCDECPDCPPGEYVQLSVRDNGCGMDKETLERIFEPFFTTKDLGQGTGLGLSTVYGIVKQNQGFINVRSKPGEGTTFRICLPRAAGGAEATPAGGKSQTCARGRETILLVEDDAPLLALGKTMLESLGYPVLAAGTPTQAIALAQDGANRIDLVITDVVMPEMNGKDLCEKLRQVRPGLKHLFVSGYAADAIARHGILDDDVMLVQKPFSRQGLSQKVREALDRR